MNAKKAKRDKVEEKDTLDKILQVVTDTCYAKGWSWTVESIDERSRKFASVSFERYSGHGHNSGLFDVTVGPPLKVQTQITSTFNTNGIEDLASAVKAALIEAGLIIVDAPKKPDAFSQVGEIVALLRKFHRVAIQLTRRHSNRQSLSIGDEYDVQDLLYALLVSRYEDVRAEEPTPSYAGGASRMDFLLKNESIVVEAKYASERLRDKRIGEELIIDISRYQSHPSCRFLICFVYDPEHQIRNPEGLEADLSKKHGNLDVRVIVNPK